MQKIALLHKSNTAFQAFLNRAAGHFHVGIQGWTSLLANAATTSPSNAAAAKP